MHSEDAKLKVEDIVKRSDKELLHGLTRQGIITFIPKNEGSIKYKMVFTALGVEYLRRNFTDHHKGIIKIFDVKYSRSHTEIPNYACWSKIKYKTLNNEEVSVDYYFNYPFEALKSFSDYFETLVNKSKVKSHEVVVFKTREQCDHESEFLTEFLKDI